jgi:hypothetical protein
MFAESLSAFFDLSGFATLHTIAGTPNIVCIIGDKTTGRSELDGTWISMFDVMVKKSDITAPVKNRKLSFDGTSYAVENVKDDGAVLTITLSDAREGTVLNQV